MQQDPERNFLLQDIQHTGLAVDHISIEIGCPGHFMPGTISRLAKSCQVAENYSRLDMHIISLHIVTILTIYACLYTHSNNVPQ